MKATRTIMTLAAAALVVAGLPSVAAAQEQAGAGLWEADHTADLTNCDFGFSADTNGFCIADDPEGVELGVKFQTTQPVSMTGVRLYRADAGPLRAALWSPDGTRLAQVDLPAADLSFENGWQDVTFASPIPSTPGTTYIASYYTGSARYAYEHRFFTDSDYSVGPLVALQSVQGDGNGVFCYGGESCFPHDTFRDSNYWVTPLWSYDFGGFAEVGETEWVEAKAGRAIPVSFSLGDDFGLGVLADGYPRMERIACSAGDGTLAEMTSADASGASGLTFNAETQRYHYVWKTPKNAAGGCFAFRLGLDDGSVHSFNVRFVR